MTEFEVWYSFACTNKDTGEFFEDVIDSVNLWADTPEEALELFTNREWFKVKVFSIDCEGQEVWYGEKWYN